MASWTSFFCFSIMTFSVVVPTVTFFTIDSSLMLLTLRVVFFVRHFLSCFIA